MGCPYVMPLYGAYVEFQPLSKFLVSFGNDGLPINSRVFTINSNISSISSNIGTSVFDNTNDNIFIFEIFGDDNTPLPYTVTLDFTFSTELICVSLDKPDNPLIFSQKIFITSSLFNGSSTSNPMSLL